MRRLARLLPLLLLWPSGCFGGQRGMNMGDYFFNRGKYYMAEREFLTVARKDPKNLFAWVAAGTAASANNRPLQAYKILYEGSMANPDTLLLPLVASELIGYDQGAPILGDQLGMAYQRFATIASDHELDPGYMDEVVAGSASPQEEENESAPKRMAAIAALQPKADAGKASPEELLLLGVAHGTGMHPDRARAAEYLSGAVKGLPRSVLAHYQLIYVRRFLAHRRVWRALTQRKPDRKAAAAALKPLIEDVHQAMADLPDDYVSVLALRTKRQSPYLYEYYAPWAVKIAKERPKSALAQYMAGWALASYSRLSGLGPKGYDLRGRKYLERAVALAPQWKEGQAPRRTLETLVLMEKMRPEMQYTPRDFEKE